MKFTQAELAAIAHARTVHQNMSQRALAAKLHNEFTGIGQSLYKRSEAAIYSNLRRYDRKTLAGATPIQAELVNA